MDRPLHEQVRPTTAHERRCGAHLLDIRPRTGGTGRVGEHGDARIDLELNGGVRRRDRDVGELLRVRVGIDGAVAVDEYTILEAHEKDTRDHRDAGVGLDDLEPGTDGVRCRVRRARDHAVSQSEVHHHRAEVRDVGDGVAGLLEAHALVRAQPGVFLGKSLAQLRIEGAQEGGLGDVETELGGARANVDFVAKDRELGDPATQQRGCGAQNAVVRSLRQNNALGIGSCPVEQVVFEHERGDHVGAAHVEKAQQHIRVDMLLEQGEGGVVFALRLGGEPPPSLRYAARGVISAVAGADDRDRAVEAIDEQRDLRKEFESAVQDDRGNRRERLGRVRHQHAEQHVGSISGHDDDSALDEPGQDVLHRHRSDDDPEGFPTE